MTLVIVWQTLMATQQLAHLQQTVTKAVCIQLTQTGQFTEMPAFIPSGLGAGHKFGFSPARAVTTDTCLLVLRRQSVCMLTHLLRLQKVKKSALQL